ncbi:prolyl oligopeptidase family serine peptidase [Persicitalea sp.]|uniref:carboxylesterase family protein n=1 Tax=Persicitalea sp. TaxID=3100273 RepID=UPI0035933C39
MTLKTIYPVRLTACVLLLFLAYCSYAQNLDQYEKREFKTDEGNTLPYRLLFPENYDKAQKYPLILFLHGAGERGNDNEKQLVHGANMFLDAQNRERFPAIVVMPQCPEESYWSSVKVDRDKRPMTFNFDYSNSSNWPLEAAYDLVKQMVGEESVDTRRLYIMGLSMGGMGTFEQVYRHPKAFAAAAPICSGADVAAYDKRVRKTPFWVFHGDADSVVPVKNSREIVEKLKTVKVPVKYTEYPGVNHNSWDNAFAEPELLPWLFSHSRRRAKL